MQGLTVTQTSAVAAAKDDPSHLPSSIRHARLQRITLTQTEAVAAAKGGPSYLPSMEVQGCQLSKIWIRHVHIERLGLVDESASIRSHLHEGALPQLPHCFIKCLQLTGYFKPLHLSDRIGGILHSRQSLATKRAATVV